MRILAIVLTFNEEIHLDRCLGLLKGIVTDLWVVDSYSTDKTVEIAKSNGAHVLQNKWVNHSEQVKWALTQIPDDVDWVMRVDADEYLSSDFIFDIKNKLHGLPNDVAGVYCGLRRIFMGKMIRFGAVNIDMMRLWRNGRGFMESRWMDEHIRLDGKSIHFAGYIIDHNLNSLYWWTNKHNGYSSREVIEMLNNKYQFHHRNDQKLSIKSQAGLKRFIKEKIYIKLPCGLRAFVYFIFRYVFALGFLDGFPGFAFHFLQGFWYRFLVDAKFNEVQKEIENNNLDVIVAIKKVLDIKIDRI